MAEPQATWSVTLLGDLLDVSRSGFDTSFKRHEQAIDADDMDLRSRVKALQREPSGCHGSRRLAKALQAEGLTLGRHRAGGLMQKAVVSVRRCPRHRPQTTDRDHRYRVAGNDLARPVDVAAPQMAWAAAMTSILYGPKPVGDLWRCSWRCRLVKGWAGR